MRLEDLGVFRAVHDTGSFQRAAHRVGLRQSAVTKVVRRWRTSSIRNWWSQGRPAHHPCPWQPRAPVLVTSSAAFGRIVLAPLVSHFMERHPKVRVDMLLVDRLVDLVDEGIDVAFRMGDLTSSSLVGRRVGQMKRVLCASPLFLAKHGPITEPQELSGADGLAPTRELLRLTLTHPTLGEQRVELSPRLVASPLDALLPALLDGLGVAWMPEFSAYNVVQDGRLVEILPEWTLPAGGMTMLYPSHRGVAPAVSAFMEFAAANYRKYMKVRAG